VEGGGCFVTHGGHGRSQALISFCCVLGVELLKTKSKGNEVSQWLLIRRHAHAEGCFHSGRVDCRYPFKEVNGYYGGSRIGTWQT